ncbi:hypothetical protein [Rhizobium sp. S163]|uniref:hypothetical protein n=1 Tax=Rhizobium sp. S163 TaxID=3055039 RepID=UPI0025A99DDE|nr:hypothetical protein [Rhizobium sp. S163]MDM9649086.1 hypothetical protein [Rhizobium sp. S163]
MNLKHTNVVNTTPGTVTVEFYGEGNELITVRMGADHDLDDGRSILHAKAMMVQLTAFDDSAQADAVAGEGDSIGTILENEE